MCECVKAHCCDFRGSYLLWIQALQTQEKVHQHKVFCLYGNGWDQTWPDCDRVVSTTLYVDLPWLDLTWLMARLVLVLQIWTHFCLWLIWCVGTRSQLTLKERNSISWQRNHSTFTSTRLCTKTDDWSLAEYYVRHQNSISTHSHGNGFQQNTQVFFFFLHHLQSQQYNVSRTAPQDKRSLKGAGHRLYKRDLWLDCGHLCCMSSYKKRKKDVKSP